VPLIAPEGLLLSAIAGVFAVRLRHDSQSESARYIDTRFGQIALVERQILEFPSGMPGFEQARRFVLIDLESPRFSPFLLLQGIDGGTPSVAVLPRDIRCEIYRTGDLSDAARTLGIAFEDCGLLLVSTIRRTDAEVAVTVNLRAPIFVDLRRRSAWQKVLPNDRYAIRHRLR